MKQIPTQVVTRAFILVLMLAVLPALVFAQAGGATAEIKGKVTDPNGGGVPGVSITVMDAAKGIGRTVTSDAEGGYRVLSLPPGTYQLKVEPHGFKTQVLNDVQVTVGQFAQHDFILEVGAVTEMVNITSDAPVIEAERTQQSNTIDEQAIRNLPIDRRNYLTYTLLAPGVVDSMPWPTMPTFAYRRRRKAASRSTATTDAVTTLLSMGPRRTRQMAACALRSDRMRCRSFRSTAATTTLNWEAPAAASSTSSRRRARTTCTATYLVSSEIRSWTPLIRLL